MSSPIFRDLGVYSKTIINTVPVQQGGVLVPAVIGFGRDWFIVSSEPVTKSPSSNNDNTANPITKVLNRVGDTPTGSDYVIGVDVDIQPGPGYAGVVWNNTVLTPPTITGASVIATGGNFGVGTWFFVITSLNAWGETIASTEVQVDVLAGATNSIQLDWSLVPKAATYKVYGSLASGVYNTPAYVAQTANTSLVITSTAFAAGAPPVANTAYNKPAANATFYVTYDYYKAAADYQPRFVTSFSDVQTNYGGDTINTGTFNSPVYTLNPLGLAADLIFANGAQGMFMVQLNNITQSNPVNTLTAASGDGDIRNAFKNALAQLEGKNAYYIVGLSTNQYTRQDIFDHVTKMSSEERRAERVMFYSFAPNTTIGDPTTGGTMTGIAQSYSALGGKLAGRIVLVANNEGTKLVQNDDGSSQTLNLTGEYFAAAMAGKQSGMQRITFPINRKPISGIDTMTPFSEENRLFLQNNAVSVLFYVGETIISVSRLLTCAKDLIEYQELTTLQQIDVIASDMRQTLENIFIVSGDAIIDETTPILIQNMVNVILKRDVQNKLISKFFPDSTTAKQDENTPTLINITYKMKLVYPLLNAEITQVISLA